jgi:antitoxin component of RelBE/YafQ-DinJ toxin-antitoxin module
MSEDTTNIIFRIERELKEEFEQIAKEGERTVSQYLRAFIKHEVRKYRQAVAIDPESISKAKATPTITQDEKTQPKPKKGQKLNRMPPRKNAK